MDRAVTGLRWKPDVIGKLVADNGITCRGQLATRLEGAGVARSSVYRTFTEDWGGEASVFVLLAIARTFAVPAIQLVNDPSWR